MSQDIRSPDGASPGENRCQTCGSFVTATFARVFGDNQNAVHSCLNCSTIEELQRG